MSLRDAVALLIKGQPLPPDLFAAAFGDILSGAGDAKDIASFLRSLPPERVTTEQLILAAQSLRDHAVAFEAANAFDCCGTGGDGSHSLNISTATALIVAACGVKVAKHGNRSVSSRSGSADVLEALGARLDVPAPITERCLRDTGFAFLMAPLYHPAMQQVAPIRKRLGIRTIFNLLGPLANPARPASQLIGVYDPSLLEPFALALKALGCTGGWIVHGHGAFDEITLTGPATCIALEHGNLRRFTVAPEDFGLAAQPPGRLAGGDAAFNAAAMRRLLQGEAGPYRDTVLANAAASLVAAGRCTNLKVAVATAAAAIDNGAAHSVLEQFIAIGHTGAA